MRKWFQWPLCPPIPYNEKYFLTEMSHWVTLTLIRDHIETAEFPLISWKDFLWLLELGNKFIFQTKRSRLADWYYNYALKSQGEKDKRGHKLKQSQLFPTITFSF